MWTIKFWQSTTEWVVVAVAAALLPVMLDGGIHSWADLGQAAGSAAAVALVKCLLASRTGQGTPALVEPDPVIRVVPELGPATAVRRSE